MKPLAINTGHRLMRGETKPAVPGENAGLPKTPTSVPTQPKHQRKPRAPTTTTKGAKVSAGVVAAGGWVVFDNNKGSDTNRHTHLVCKQPVAGVVGTVAAQVRVGQSHAAANTIGLPCKAWFPQVPACRFKILCSWLCGPRIGSVALQWNPLTRTLEHLFALLPVFL